MTIQEIISQGQGLTLDKITVKDDYGLKTGKTNHRAILVSDGSGQTVVKLWGAASGNQFTKGQVITLTGVGAKGGLAANEWPAGSGKFSINANDCEVTYENGGDTQPAPQQAAQPAYTPTPQTGGSMTGDQLHEKMMMEFDRKHAHITSKGVSANEAAIAAASMVGNITNWFFGEKNTK